MKFGKILPTTNVRDEIKMNIPFFLYFVGMFCLYYITYFQLAIQIILILYFCLLLVKRGLRVSGPELRRMGGYLLWYGAFALIVFLSRYWAYSTVEDSNTFFVVIRSFAVGGLIYYYADTKEKVLGILKSFIYAFFIMSMVVLATTPISGWGSEFEFGRLIHMHRNGLGAISSPLIIICYFLYTNYGIRYCNYLSLYFVFFTLIGGSRGAYLQVILIFVVHLLVNEKQLSKRLKNLVVFAAIGLVIIVLMLSIPFLYEVVWLRFGSAISAVLGINMGDTSAEARVGLQEIATMLFLDRPLLGYGMDGVVCFIRDNPVLLGPDVAPVYSHCNYTEIAACYGIVGLIIWYVPMIVTIVKSYKIRTTSKWASCLFACFLSMNVLDYCRIPWVTHQNMYLLFIVMLLIFYEGRDVRIKAAAKRQEKNSEVTV